MSTLMEIREVDTIAFLRKKFFIILEAALEKKVASLLFYGGNGQNLIWWEEESSPSNSNYHATSFLVDQENADKHPFAGSSFPIPVNCFSTGHIIYIKTRWENDFTFLFECGTLSKTNLK